MIELLTCVALLGVCVAMVPAGLALHNRTRYHEAGMVLALGGVGCSVCGVVAVLNAALQLALAAV